MLYLSIMSSIKDVAKLAGVSISTVSRVINKNVPVDTKTQECVEKAILRLNYRPNLLARGLRKKTGYLIGFIVPELYRLHASTILADAAERSAFSFGYNLILGCTHHDPDIEEKLIDSLIKRHVDGIIAYAVEDDRRFVHVFKNTSIPVVFINWKPQERTIPCVLVDNYKAGQLAAQHLLSLGHTKVGCVTGLMKHFFCAERLRGFRETLKLNSIELEQVSVFEGNYWIESGREAAGYFLHKARSVTAIWAQNDLMAAGMIQELNRRNIKVPNEMSIIGMDDSFYAQILTPALTTIRQPFEAMCEKAFVLINNMKVQSNRTFLMDPELVIRETTSKLL
ncbi:MAG: LacI family DNA-binding transcriptional regulator [Spirochaetota bacterium]